jgi:hypothetical protein
MLGMSQSPHSHQEIPASYIERIIKENLNDKKNELFYNHRHEGSFIDFKSQRLFSYQTAFANPDITRTEKLYASYSSEQQAELVNTFSCIKKIIETLRTSDVSEQDLKTCITQSYEKLTPLVWRVHLLWLLRFHNAEICGDALASIFQCAPCRYDLLRASVAFGLAAYYYYVILLTMSWSKNNYFMGEKYVIPLACFISCFFDLIVTPLNQYTQAKKFIHEKFKKYTLWKKITDDLARTMEETYKPL